MEALQDIKRMCLPEGIKATWVINDKMNNGNIKQ